MKVTWAKALELFVDDPLGWARPLSFLCHGHFVFSVPFTRHTESAHPLQDAPQESRPVNNEDREMSQHVGVPLPTVHMGISVLLSTPGEKQEV